MLESSVERHFIRCVKERRGRCWKLKFLGVAGAPDRLVVFPGPRIYLVELKRPKGGRISPLQARLHRVLTDLGWPPVLLRSKEEIDLWIELS